MGVKRRRMSADLTGSRASGCTPDPRYPLSSRQSQRTTQPGGAAESRDGQLAVHPTSGGPRSTTETDT
jgi:hypothetical protein